MTPPLDAELLDRLRVAWNAARMPPEQTGDRLPDLLPRRTVAAARMSRCEAHGEPSQWEDEPAPYRPGWIRSTCRICGGFVGYRLKRNATPEKNDRHKTLP